MKWTCSNKHKLEKETLHSDCCHTQHTYWRETMLRVVDILEINWALINIHTRENCSINNHTREKHSKPDRR